MSSPDRRRNLLGTSLFAALFLLLSSSVPAQNETPGIGKKNHTAYFFAPYRWANPLFEIGRWVKPSVATKADGTSGQQYDWVEIVETKKPSTAKPAATCTVETFRDLLKKNRDDMGVLIISSHGSKNSVSVEPFETEKDRDTKYNKYINDGTFTKDEIVKTSNDDSFAIGVTDKFIEKYRDVGQALVYISACEGGTLADDFTEAREQAAARLARVALGGNSISKVAAYTEYATRFFKDLDGQERTGKPAADRLKLRAVKASMEANNEMSKTAPDADLRVEFSLTGNGDTTLAPVVKEGTDICVASPLKTGDKITFTFDTNCDTATVPTVEAAGAGVTLGAAAWKTGSKNVLEVPVTGPAAGTTTFKITLKGDTVKALKNEAKLDGNTNPDKVNGQGPATHKDKADDYVIEFKDGKRVH